ncbi:hypothetical protein MSIMFB_05603 [Mycobacterium simulans]|uniref:Lipoprotein LppV n=1 Tax=Mycobacterium simulans TaxID=627089 RepID=A0A7Z7NCN0_9MYCO|nr:LppA family lipoprotein [Mycobacterium simulans]SOJ58123.1 hypothetical protein MSIMFB_05603 [Mycobacterium simulans]
MSWRMMLVLTVLCAIIVGCGNTNGGNGDAVNGRDRPVSPERLAALEDGLRSKPPLEDAQAQYRAAVTQMADGLVALVPGLTWRLETDSWTGCGGDYEWTRAKEAYLRAVFSGPIPDDKWQRAIEIVNDGAKKFGANDFGVLKDRPGDHDVYFAGTDDVQFRVGTQVAAVLTARSDCRISQADTPAASPIRHP